MSKINRTYLSLWGLLFSIILFFLDVIIEENLGISIYLIAIGWLFFIIYLITFYKDNYQFISSSFYQIFYYVAMLISATLISTGEYMYEIQMYGNSNGVFWVCISYAIFGFEFSYIGYKKSIKNISRKKTISKNLDTIASYTIIGLTLFISVFILFRYGSPLSYEVSRVKFWGEIAPSYLSFIRPLLILTFFLTVNLYFNYRTPQKNLLLHLSLVFIYVVFVFVLLGEKFSVLVMYASVWFLISSCYSTNIKAKKTYIKIALLSIFLLAYVGYIYEGMGLGYRFIYNRLVLQGQVLWSVLNENLSILTMGIQINCIPDCSEYIDGRNFIAYRYLPQYTYKIFQESGTSLSGFMPSLQILFLGIPISLISHFFLSFYLGFIQGRMISNVLNNQLLLSFFYFCLYFSIVIIWFVGNLNLIKLVLFIYILIFIYRVIILSR